MARPPVDDQASIVIEYVDGRSTETEVESGAASTTMLIVPADGLTPKVIQDVNNSGDAWKTLRSEPGIELLRPITMSALMRSDVDGVDWRAEEATVRSLASDKTVRKVTLIVPATDGTVLAYVMPEPTADDESYLTGV